MRRIKNGSGWIHSLKAKAVVLAVLIQLPLVFLFAFWYRQTTENIRQEVIRNDITNARLCSEKIEICLQLASSQLKQYYRPNQYINYQTASPDQRILEYIQQQLDLGNLESNSSPVKTFFVYSHIDDYYVENLGSVLLGKEHDDIIALVKTEEQHVNQWQIESLGNRQYILYLLPIHNMTYGTCVLWDDLVKEYMPRLYNPESELQVVDAAGTLLGSHRTDSLPESMILQANDNVQMEKAGYYDIMHSSNGLDYYLFLPQNYRQGIMDIIRANPVFMLVPVLILLSSLLTLWFLWRAVIRPVELMRYGLKRLERNDLAFRLPERGFSSEMNEMNRSYNSTIRKIHELKMDIYEKDLEKERYEQQWLHSNLKPHFILNNLTTIDNLASMQDYERIKILVANLAGYLRNSIGADITEAPLKENLATVRSYLNLMQFMYPGLIDYVIACDPEAENMAFPPLILCVICENAIKYGFSPTRGIRIRLDCRIIRKQQDALRIVVYNNGTHFPESVCQDINHNQSRPIVSSHHMGLQSIKRRLEIIYGNRCSFSISNLEDGVAATIVLEEPVPCENESVAGGNVS